MWNTSNSYWREIVSFKLIFLFLLILILIFRRRARHVKAPEDVTEKRILLEKKWSAFKQQQHLADVQMVDRLLFAQQKALDELRKQSEDLYQAAIQVNIR